MSPDFPRAAPSGQALRFIEGERKHLATLRAALALRQGHVVHELSDGGYLVAWRGLSRECRDLAELEAHARRVGAL